MTRAYRALLQHTNLPILVGPFRGEVGFEALYWIPWLAKLRLDLKIAPERIIPIARGGAAVWYQAPTGLELYAMRDPKAIRIENRVQHAASKMLKQTSVTAFDKAVLRDAAQTLGFKRYLTLHPSQMYRELAPFWEAHRGAAWLMDRAAYQVPWNAPPLPDGVTLPTQFVAVRFYARYTYPPCEQTATFARETIAQLASQMPVVLLNSGLHTDDHVDFVPKTPIPNVFKLNDLIPMLPETNLAVQSAVLARAMGFVGTYGGLAQLALLLGKPSVSLYTEWGGTAFPHKHLADLLSLRTGIPCIVHRLAETGLLQNVLPRVIAPAPTQLAIPDPQPESTKALTPVAELVT